MGARYNASIWMGKYGAGARREKNNFHYSIIMLYVIWIFKNLLSVQNCSHVSQESCWKTQLNNKNARVHTTYFDAHCVVFLYTHTCDEACADGRLTWGVGEHVLRSLLVAAGTTYGSYILLKTTQRYILWARTLCFSREITHPTSRLLPKQLCFWCVYIGIREQWNTTAHTHTYM